MPDLEVMRTTQESLSGNAMSVIPDGKWPLTTAAICYACLDRYSSNIAAKGGIPASCKKLLSVCSEKRTYIQDAMQYIHMHMHI
jgi:hypothetical protein